VPLINVVFMDGSYMAAQFFLLFRQGLLIFLSNVEKNKSELKNSLQNQQKFRDFLTNAKKLQFLKRTYSTYQKIIIRLMSLI
jgi:hypothetical protein